jgi:hypothetical protein
VDLVTRIVIPVQARTSLGGRPVGARRPLEPLGACSWRRRRAPKPSSCNRDIGLREIVGLEQERLAAGAGQRISETVAEVQAGRTSAAFAEIAIGGAGDLGLLAGSRLDDDASTWRGPGLIPPSPFSLLNARSGGRRLQ